MKHAFEDYKSIKKKTEAPHELADMTELIRKTYGFTKRYTRGFWLKRLKKSGLSYFSLKKLIKQSEELDKKYNIVGWIVNKLK